MSKIVDAVPEIQDIARQISQWQHNCDLRHAHCAASQDTTLPDRVLYLGQGNASPLAQLHEPNGALGRYVALSYCWGGKAQYQLNAETLSDLTKGVAATLLPRTIRDAIQLTRELGISFVWIDALCIAQDSQQDWEEQSAKMGSIYRNARLTLIASRAAAVTEGFLGPTKQQAAHCGVATFQDRVRPVFLIADPDDSDDPLSRRGWAFQERQLSTCKVVFGSTEMVWECQQASVCESIATKRLPRSVPTPGALLKWINQVEAYSGSLLTRASDRLPAISGYAKHYAERSGDEYIAGHWKSFLIPSLMWRIMGSCDPAKQTHGYIAPSWSWASVGHMNHAFDVPVTIEPIARLINHSVTLAGLNPYGEVTSGWIELSAPMFDIDHRKIPLDPYFRVPCNDYTPDQFAQVAISAGSEEVQKACREKAKGRLDPNKAAQVFWDWRGLASSSINLSCVVLAKEPRTRDLFGIVVQPVSGCPGTFRRVGMFLDCVDVFTKDLTRIRTIRIV